MRSTVGLLGHRTRAAENVAEASVSVMISFPFIPMDERMKQETA